MVLSSQRAEIALLKIEFKRRKFSGGSTYFNSGPPPPPPRPISFFIFMQSSWKFGLRIACSGGSRISPRRGVPTPQRGANICFCQIFPKTSWNRKNLGAQRGACPLAPPRSANGWRPPPPAQSGTPLRNSGSASEIELSTNISKLNRKPLGCLVYSEVRFVTLVMLMYNDVVCAHNLWAAWFSVTMPSELRLETFFAPLDLEFYKGDTCSGTCLDFYSNP